MNLVPPITRMFLELDAVTCSAPLVCHTFLLHCNQIAQSTIAKVVPFDEFQMVQLDK